MPISHSTACTSASATAHLAIRTRRAAALRCMESAPTPSHLSSRCPLAKQFAKAPVLLKKDVRMTVGDATRILDCLVREGKAPFLYLRRTTREHVLVA